jgi:hypothetical protein
MFATLNWMKSYSYRREMNRHWSVSTSRHGSGDGKRQSAKNGLWLMIYSLLSLNRSFLFVMKSEIIFRNFSYIWLRFLSLSVYSRCLAARERIWSADDLFFWISFNQIRVASQLEHSLDFRKSLNPCKICFAVRAISIFAYLASR